MASTTTRTIVAIGTGLLFGGGLTISGLINPAKVLNFLDVLGLWDPSLLVVMAGAVAVTLIGYRLVLRRSKPLLADAFQIPKRSDIDKRLLGGAAVFGLGWGLVGFCPGPALAALAIAGEPAVTFVLAMAVGMFLADQLFATKAAKH